MKKEERKVDWRSGKDLGYESQKLKSFFYHVVVIHHNQKHFHTNVLSYFTSFFTSLFTSYNMITNGFNGTDVSFGYMGTSECEEKEFIQLELENHDFEQEAELFLAEVELKATEETCTYEEYVTAPDHTVVDGPGLAIAQQMGWNGNWQGLGANGTGRRDPITTGNSVVRRGQDRTGIGREGNYRSGNEKISFVPASYFVQGETEVIGESSLPPPPMGPPPMGPPPPPAGYPAFSICIPHVFSNIGEPRIRAIFRELGYPNIESIDFVRIHKTGAPANKVFVHFCAATYTSRDQIVDQTINMILRGDTVKIIYDEPWFWNVSKSRSKRPAYCRPAPRIAF